MHPSSLLQVLAATAATLLFTTTGASPVADRGDQGRWRGDEDRGHGRDKWDDHHDDPRPHWPTSTKATIPTGIAGNCTQAPPMTKFWTVTETTTATATKLKGYSTVTVVTTLPRNTKIVYAGTKTISVAGPTITKTSTIHAGTKTVTVSIPGPTKTKTVTVPVNVPGPTVTKTATVSVRPGGSTQTVTIPAITRTVTIPAVTSTVTSTTSVTSSASTNTTTTATTSTTSSAPSCIHTSPILDGGFENTPEGAWTDISHATDLVDTTVPYTGNAVAAFQNTSPNVLHAIYFGDLHTGNAVRQSIPVCPGSTYSLSLRGYVLPSNELANVTATAKVYLGADKVIELVLVWDRSKPEAFGWEKGVGEWVAPAGRWAAGLKVEIDMDGEGLRHVALDDLEMKLKA
ncbi:hypothetical protein DFH27DRAFT_652104 [Peziza echinospora]|nr:hypothetical protein DFH27DRAFT_652104 [Peziza echinospora]